MCKGMISCDISVVLLIFFTLPYSFMYINIPNCYKDKDSIFFQQRGVIVFPIHEEKDNSNGKCGSYLETSSDKSIVS